MLDDKIKFETLAELQDKYPIGSIFNERKHAWSKQEYYYNDTDLKVLKQRYDSVFPIDENRCICFKMDMYQDIVEGYLYNGKYWYPVHLTYNGWTEYDEYDLNRGK